MTLHLYTALAPKHADAAGRLAPADQGAPEHADTAGRLAAAPRWAPDYSDAAGRVVVSAAHGAPGNADAAALGSPAVQGPPEPAGPGSPVGASPVHGSTEHADPASRVGASAADGVAEQADAAGDVGALAVHEGPDGIASEGDAVISGRGWRRAAGLAGIDGAAVRLLEAGPVVVAVSEHAEQPVATEASLHAHARVALSLGGVPFRFAAGPSTAEDLKRQVAPKAAGLAAKLKAVGDCVEMVIRLPQPDDRSSGTAYLRAKKRAAGEIEALKEGLQDLVRDLREAPDGRLLCLVPRSRLADFRARVHGRDVSGPWPPSSFV